MSVIDDYLKNVSPSERKELERIRTIAKKVAPEADETITYGMPVLKVNGKYMIGFAAFKDHLSIFPGATPVRDTIEKLKGYKLSKGTIQFTLTTPLSDSLIKELAQQSLEISKKR